VHARSVAAAAIDGLTGEVFKARLCPAPTEIIAWIGGLPGPCAVVYESGPTGFGLARALAGAGVRCEVAAASKIVRPGGDRVKTDTRDALLLARLRLDEVVPVQVPTEEQESARDLVRCREATRADLMRAATGCPSRCCATASCTAAGAPIMFGHHASQPHVSPGRPEHATPEVTEPGDTVISHPARPLAASRNGIHIVDPTRRCVHRPLLSVASFDDGGVAVGEDGLS